MKLKSRNINSVRLCPTWIEMRMARKKPICFPRWESLQPKMSKLIFAENNTKENYASVKKDKTLFSLFNLSNQTTPPSQFTLLFFFQPYYIKDPRPMAKLL